MSIESYEKQMAQLELYSKLADAISEIESYIQDAERSDRHHGGHGREQGLRHGRPCP